MPWHICFRSTRAAAHVASASAPTTLRPGSAARTKRQRQRDASGATSSKLSWDGGKGGGKICPEMTTEKRN